MPGSPRSASAWSPTPKPAPFPRAAPISVRNSPEITLSSRQPSGQRLPSPVQFFVLRVRDLFFNFHVAEFVRVENLAAFHAFNILDVFLAGDDTDSRGFAGARHLRLVTVRFEEAFAPDFTGPWPFVEEGFDKHLQGCLPDRKKLAFLAVQGRIDILPHPLK